MRKEEMKKINEKIIKSWATVGMVAVFGEELNQAMGNCCNILLQMKGLDQKYGEIVLVGLSNENMRRTFISLLKKHYKGDEHSLLKIKAIGKKVENLNRRRNKMIHSFWSIGWIIGQTHEDNFAEGIHVTKDMEQGGVTVNKTNQNDLENLARELEDLVFKLSIIPFNLVGEKKVDVDMDEDKLSIMRATSLL